jgi:hypothetical protein
MRWIARGFVFTVALGFGNFAASLFWDSTDFQAAAPQAAPFETINAEVLLGVWTGTWGYNSGDCTITIDRVDGNKFNGKLRKEGAEILIQGAFDAATRKVDFSETKVVRLGDEMNEWSLGRNSGTISRDGRTLVGTGRDEWGQYAWAVSN